MTLTFPSISPLTGLVWKGLVCGYCKVPQRLNSRHSAVQNFWRRMSSRSLDTNHPGTFSCGTGTVTTSVPHSSRGAKKNSASPICCSFQQKLNLQTLISSEGALEIKWKHSHLNLGSSTFSCLELSIIIYSGLMSLRCAQPWSTLHTPHAPLSLSSHSMQVLSGRKNPMTYFPNLFQLLQAKNSLCNLNTFFSNHSNRLHGVLFSKEIKIHLTVCGGCYRILCFANLNSNDFGIWVESTGYIRTNN